MDTVVVLMPAHVLPGHVEALATKLEHVNIMREVTVAACHMAADGLKPVEHTLCAVREMLEKRKPAGATYTIKLSAAILVQLTVVVKAGEDRQPEERHLFSSTSAMPKTVVYAQDKLWKEVEDALPTPLDLNPDECSAILFSTIAYLGAELRSASGSGSFSTAKTGAAAYDESTYRRLIEAVRHTPGHRIKGGSEMPKFALIKIMRTITQGVPPKFPDRADINLDAAVPYSDACGTYKITSEKHLKLDGRTLKDSDDAGVASAGKSGTPGELKKRFRTFMNGLYATCLEVDEGGKLMVMNTPDDGTFEHGGRPWVDVLVLSDVLDRSDEMYDLNVTVQEAYRTYLGCFKSARDAVNAPVTAGKLRTNLTGGLQAMIPHIEHRLRMLGDSQGDRLADLRGNPPPRGRGASRGGGGGRGQPRGGGPPRGGGLPRGGGRGSGNPVVGRAPFSGNGRTLGSVVKAISLEEEEADEEGEASADAGGAILRSPPKKARTAAEARFERMIGGNPQSDKDCPTPGACKQHGRACYFRCWKQIGA